MTGRAEVDRLKSALDNVFTRAAEVDGTSELKSDLARYLCVLVSGFLEKAVAELLLEHARRHANLSVQRFVDSQTRRITNVNCQRLQDVLGAFDPDWRLNLETFLVDERKAAVDSLIDLRNSISHGRHVGVTFTRIQDYYRNVQQVVDRVAQLCVP